MTTERGVSDTRRTFAVALSDEAYRKIEAKKRQVKNLQKKKFLSVREIDLLRKQISALEIDGLVTVGIKIASFTH